MNGETKEREDDESDNEIDVDDIIPPPAPDVTYEERAEYEARVLQHIATRETDPALRAHYQRLADRTAAHAIEVRSPTWQAEQDARNEATIRRLNENASAQNQAQAQAKQ
jgi:hypothetical protein